MKTSHYFKSPRLFLIQFVVYFWKHCGNQWIFFLLKIENVNEPWKCKKYTKYIQNICDQIGFEILQRKRHSPRNIRIFLFFATATNSTTIFYFFINTIFIFTQLNEIYNYFLEFIINYKKCTKMKRQLEQRFWVKFKVFGFRIWHHFGKRPSS